MNKTHDWIAPESFQVDAPYGAKTCSKCRVCTCHDRENLVDKECSGAPATYVGQ